MDRWEGYGRVLAIALDHTEKVKGAGGGRRRYMHVGLGSAGVVRLTVPAEAANLFHVGQPVTISIDPREEREEEEQQPAPDMERGMRN